MRGTAEQRQWLWATVMLSSISVVAVVFSAWELLESRFFREANYATLHYLYITRGITSSLLLAAWAAWFVLRQRRRAEQELQRSREHYHSLLDSSPGAVALYDQDLLVAEWNATAERLYGYGREEVLGRRLPTIVPAREQELEELLARVQRGEHPDLETLRRDKSGSDLPVQLKLLPFRHPSGRDYFLEVTEDFRDRVRLREKLLEIEKLTSMGNMAAGTAHHLNTPLAAMLLRVEMMRDRSHHGACLADLEQLEGSLKFCQHFVRTLLDFSRRSSMAEKEPMEIRPALESVVNFLQPTILARQARVSLELDAAGEFVLADKSQVETLVIVLVSNAIDAIPADGKVVVRCRRGAPGWLELEIEDRGCGIPDAHVTRVFEPFFTTKPPGKGTGLGLSIARNIVMAHGGKISLESKSGVGTKVRVQLPVLQQEAMTIGARR